MSNQNKKEPKNNNNKKNNNKSKKIPFNFKAEYVGFGSGSNGEDDTTNSLFGRLKGKPFWDWEEGENHLPKYDEQTGLIDCCFNCIVGWPEKHGVKHPMYEYEKMVYDALMERTGDDTDKHVWIKKATGLGITEFILRWMVWLATRNDDLKGSNMCIVTGPNHALATDLIERIRLLFIEFPDVNFEVDASHRIKINNIMIQAYPSHNLDAMRGIADVSVSFLDEAAFFGKQGQDTENPRTISERYVGKSNPYLIMCSTPNLEDDMFGSIEFES